MPLVRDEAPWRTSTGAFGFTAIAVLLLWRAPRSRAAQRFLPAALVWSLCWIEFQGGPPAQTYAYLGVRAVAGSLWAPLMLLAVRELPDRGPPRAAARWPWLFALLGPTWTSMWFGWPLPIEVGTRLNPALGGLAIAALLAVLTQSYRSADTAGRRQLEWVMLGGYLGGLPVLLGVAAAALDPERVWLWNWSLTALVLIPLSFFVAITRSHLLDIDRVISTTATLSLLGMLLVGGALTALPPLVTLASNGLGLERGTVQLAFAGILAPLVVYAEQLLRPRLESFLFAERQALKLGAGGLVTELAGAADAAGLLEIAGARLEALLRPACCVVYGRAGRVYAPVHVRGAALAPTFAQESALLAALRGGGALAVEEAKGALADPADRGAIGSLGAEVLVPIARGAELTGFVALGRKASGDVYTATDRALLSAIGSALASSLARIGETELAREARAREERLARYVPAAFASELARGAPEPGEREVSVLFADLRAYSRSAQGRAPEEVFAALSRYTQIVTGPVVGHGGTVVEFAGDGIMAVFGAPEPLPAKERAAVLAALESPPACAVSTSSPAPRATPPRRSASASPPASPTSARSTPSTATSGPRSAPPRTWPPASNPSPATSTPGSQSTPRPTPAPPSPPPSHTTPPSQSAASPPRRPSGPFEDALNARLKKGVWHQNLETRGGSLERLKHGELGDP